jgi:hypothetical protein
MEHNFIEVPKPKAACRLCGWMNTTATSPSQPPMVHYARSVTNSSTLREPLRPRAAFQARQPFCPSEVRRVCFAHDNDKLRFIVDHAGLKL